MAMRLLFRGDEDVPKLVVMVLQLCKYTKATELYTYTLKW